MLIANTKKKMGRPHLLAWDSGVSRRRGEAAHLFSVVIMQRVGLEAVVALCRSLNRQ